MIVVESVKNPIYRSDDMSFAGSGYIAIIKRKQAELKRKKEKEQSKKIDKDYRKFLKKFGLM